MNGRIAGIALIGLTVVALFCMRLLHLQVFDGGNPFKNMAYAQKWKSIALEAERGKIYDRQGKVLAKSKTLNNAYILPEYIGESERTQIQESLIQILELKEEDFEGLWSKKGSIVIKKGLSDTEITKLSEYGLKAVVVRSESGRSYPESNVGAHVIGHTDQNNVGVYGLESKYDDLLQGTDGLKLIAKDLQGRVLGTESERIYPSRPGYDLHLTLDLSLQAKVDHLIQDTVNRYQPKSVSVIVSDPNTGAILALQNAPSYNPNEPNIVEKEKVTDLDQLYKLWRNPAVSDAYEPGSVYKLMTTAIALEENTSNLESTYTCDGYIRDIPGVVIRCHLFYKPHGQQTLGQALANSCNPAFVQIAREIGEEKMYAYREAFGFGRQTGVDLPAEAPGLVNKGMESVGPAELATMSYGHGFTATPIQVLTAANAVINGGKIYRPYIVESVQDREGNVIQSQGPHMERQILSDQTSQTMRSLAQMPILEGASDGAKIPGFPVLGKSGTSIKLVDGAYDSDVTVASYFAAYPAESPKYSLLVVVDEPQLDHSGNGVAGSLAKAILGALIDMEGDLPASGAGESEKTISVPEVTGMALIDAVRRLEKSGLKHRLTHEVSSSQVEVLGQNPSARTKLAYGDRVTLDVAKDPGHRVIMPRLLGLDLLKAVVELEKVGLSADTVGLGVVTNQIPMAGTLVDPEKNVQLMAEKLDQETEDQTEDSKPEEGASKEEKEAQDQDSDGSQTEAKKKNHQEQASETEAIKE